MQFNITLPTWTLYSSSLYLPLIHLSNGEKKIAKLFNAALASLLIGLTGSLAVGTLLPYAHRLVIRVLPTQASSINQALTVISHLAAPIIGQTIFATYTHLSAKV